MGEKVISMKTVISPRFTMLPEEWKNWLIGLRDYFALPLVFIYITGIYALVQLDGFQLTDFSPTQVTVDAMATLALTQAISLLKKYIPESKVVIEK